MAIENRSVDERATLPEARSPVTPRRSQSHALAHTHTPARPDSRHRGVLWGAVVALRSAPCLHG